MYVNLSKLPSPKTQYQVFLRDFSGGLNVSKASTEIADNQSPNMRNLLWENGVLKRRPGQKPVRFKNRDSFAINLDTLIAVHEKAIGNKILFAYCDGEGSCVIACCDLGDSNTDMATVTELSRDYKGGRRGSFFEYGEHIYFKGTGCYKKISFAEDGSLVSEDVVPYVPVVQINTNPETGVGDLYQPENRLSAQKEVWFNADSGVRTAEFSCDGSVKSFNLPHKGGVGHQSLLSVDSVYVGAELLSLGDDYSVDVASGTINLTSAPASTLKVTVYYSVLFSEYRLPHSVFGTGIVVDAVYVKNLSTGEYEVYAPNASVESIAKGAFQLSVLDGADGYVQVEFSDTESITFYNGKPVTDPNVLNSFVKIRYSKANHDAKKAIDDCYIVTTYGNGGLEANCVVMAGATEQWNAFFWSGNDSSGGNPGYFPIANYNLAGESYDPIMAFGKQQNKLVVFQMNRIGSATFSLDEVDGRLVVSLLYRTINDRIGCDLPGSVQLVANNLVWAHTKYGVMYLKDSTYAYETLVVCVSQNINDELLHNMTPSYTSSMDDGKRYWIFSGSNAYVWDYSIQGYTSNTERLSWFPMSGMVESACNAVLVNGTWYRFGFGSIVAYRSDYCKDFEDNFFSFFRTKDFNFGTYAYRKNVDKMILSFPRIENLQAELYYETDLENPRKDLMDIRTDTGETSDVGAYVKVRTPKCRHIHTFSGEIRSVDDAPFELIAMQIFYSFMGNKTIKAGQRM